MGLVNGRAAQSRRQWRILRLIAVDRFTTVELIADKFDVSMKTVQRDLIALEDSGFPLIWKSADGDNLRFVRLDPSFAAVFSQLREVFL